MHPQNSTANPGGVNRVILYLNTASCVSTCTSTFLSRSRSGRCVGCSRCVCAVGVRRWYGNLIYRIGELRPTTLPGCRARRCWGRLGPSRTGHDRTVPTVPHARAACTTATALAFAVGVSGASILLHTPFYVTSETVPLADTAYLYSTQSSKLCGCGTMSCQRRSSKVRIRRHPANGEHVEGARWLHHEVDYARARI